MPLWPPGARDDRLVAVTEQSTGDAVPGRWNAVGPKSSMWMDPGREEVAFAEQFVAGTPDLAIRSPDEPGACLRTYGCR